MEVTGGSSLRPRRTWAMISMATISTTRVHRWFLRPGVNRKPFDRLVRSASPWERRLTIVAASWFIRQGDFANTLKTAEKLLEDKEDLISKAAGWMLMEVRTRDVAVLEEFLASDDAPVGHRAAPGGEAAGVSRRDGSEGNSQHGNTLSWARLANSTDEG